MFILGENLFPNKQVRIALAKFVGIGRSLAEKLCHQALIHRFCKVQDLKAEQINSLSTMIERILEEEKLKKIQRLKRASFMETLKPKLPNQRR
jgi:ribosomal protein S13